MAARLPSLDQMTGARTDEYHPYHPYQCQSYQFAATENPQGEVDLSQSPLTLLGASGAQMCSDASGAHADTSPLYVEHGGALHEEFERVQSIPGLKSNFGILEDTASRHEYEQADSGNTCLGNDRQRELFTFPEGEVDAVTISASDLQGLQPTEYLGNNIIDFYIKYLERRLSSEERSRFYFFNSFFFRKLLGNSCASTDMDECEVDYDQVRKWTWETNLFEKDYVFIPILRRSHWSLIIICHLSALTGSPDKKKGSPCVFHLDPLEGIHESFEGQVRRYLYRACRERYQASKKKDDMLEALACNMKYVEAQVPRQDNSYDCGVYFLHYVETFICESISPDFSFVRSEGGPHFTSSHFAREIFEKRAVIQKLISELIENPEERAARRLDILPKPVPRAQDVHSPRPQPKCLPEPLKGRNKTILSKKWNEKETSVLLNCLVERGRIRKGTEGATHWNLISQDIKTNCKTVRSEDECRRRYDTLLKAYKRIKKIGKPFRDITDTERLELHLATPLQEEWYKVIDTICLQRRSANAKSRKRAKLNRSDGNGMVSSSPRNPPAPVIPFGCAEPEKPFRKEVVSSGAIPGFWYLDENLKSTLLNLIQAMSMKDWLGMNLPLFSDSMSFDMEVVCQWLEIVQDREPSDIRRFVLGLSELKLVNIQFESRGLVFCDVVPCLKVSDILVYKKFVEKVLCKKPHLRTYVQVCGEYDSVSFPKALLSLPLERIRVLSLYECLELEHADLRYFPELRSLAIEKCRKLKTVAGWEVAKKLGWLEIRFCSSYRDLPCVECLPSLRDFCFEFNQSSALQMNPTPDFSQCVRLRRLEIFGTNLSALNSMDLSTLRFLVVLTFDCPALTTIQGLSGLHSLTRLTLGWCEALTRVPELGCLKALTHLDMTGSGVEEIPGVQELHLLTFLVLSCCSSLKKLPYLGHLKALTYLDIGGSGVEEIPGAEGLVSLEFLDCSGSRVKWLPNPHHFPRLLEVALGGTPLSRTDPSSCYYGRESWVSRESWLSREFGPCCEESYYYDEWMDFVEEISGISDTEDDSY